MENLRVIKLKRHLVPVSKAETVGVCLHLRCLRLGKSKRFDCIKSCNPLGPQLISALGRGRGSAPTKNKRYEHQSRKHAKFSRCRNRFVSAKYVAISRR